MRKGWRSRLVVLSWIFVIAALYGALYIDGTYTKSYYSCADGWKSSSIGQQGACSHHGRVTTQTADSRTPWLVAIEWGLVLGAGGSLIFLVWLTNTYKPDDSRIPKNRPLAIVGNRVRVPLTIAQEERSVEVWKYDERRYETVEDVAIVRGEGRIRAISKQGLLREADGREV